MGGRGTERPVVGIVFCDLVGSTALLAQIGEAANDELRRDLFAAQRSIIANTGGIEVKSQGDGMMIAYPGRVAAALEGGVLLHRAVAELDRRDPDVHLALRVGIGAGPVTFEDDDWFGVPVVEAARLCALAETGQVLITQSATGYIRAEDAPCALEPIGAHPLKGLPEPVELLAARPTEPAGAVSPTVPPAVPPTVRAIAPVPAALDTTGTPALVGPAADVASQSAEALPERAVVISGEPGDGATRLAATIATGARDAGWTVLHGSPRDAESSPLAPLADAVRWWVASHSGDEIRAVLPHLPELAHAIPLVALRAGVRPSAAAPAGAAAGDGLADALRAIARHEPTVLVLDDMQQAPPALWSAVVDLLPAGSATATASGSLGLVVAGRRLDRDAADLGGDVTSGGSELVWDPGAGTSQAAPFIDKVLDHDAVSVVTVAPLDLSAARRLAGIDETALALDLAAGNPRHLVEIRRRIEAGEPPTVALARTMPYRGLRSFEPGDHSMFFGREALTDECLERLDDAGIVVVVGPSGSGKSSLVRAGVIARLREDGRRAHILTPGPHLSSRIDAASTGDAARDVLVVDQFEEVFTSLSDGERDAAFAAIRARLDRSATTGADDDAHPLVLVLRADFVGHALNSRDIGALVEHDTLLVGPLSDADLRRAIAEPLAAADLVAETGLIDVLVSETQDAPGGLPLLAHALFETWRNRRDGQLTIAAYRETGGLRGAIARTAERTYLHDLDQAEQALARSVFLRLVELGEGTEDTRRRSSRHELEGLAGAGSATLDDLLEKLVRARLITVADDQVEVAHEALIRSWPRLRSWLDEDRDALRVHRTVTRAAQDWHDNGRPDSDVWRGARLDAATEWMATHEPDATLVEREFVEASAHAAGAAARRQRREVHRLRALVAVALVFAVLAASGAVLALRQRDAADQERQTADQQRRTADEQRDRVTQLARVQASRQLAQDALTTSDADPDLAALLAAQAVEFAATPEALHAEFTVLTTTWAGSTRTELDLFTGPGPVSSDVGIVSSVGVGFDGDTLVLFDSGTNSGTTFDRSTGAKRNDLHEAPLMTPPGEIAHRYDIAVTPASHTVIDVQADGTFFRRTTVGDAGAPIASQVLSRDGSTVVAVINDPTTLAMQSVAVLDASTGAVRHTFPVPCTIQGIAEDCQLASLSEDGSTLFLAAVPTRTAATPSGAPSPITVQAFDTATGARKPTAAAVGDGQVVSMTTSPTGSVLLSYAPSITPATSSLTPGVTNEPTRTQAVDPTTLTAVGDAQLGVVAAISPKGTVALATQTASDLFEASVTRAEAGVIVWNPDLTQAVRSPMPMHGGEVVVDVADDAALTLIATQAGPRPVLMRSGAAGLSTAPRSGRSVAQLAGPFPGATNDDVLLIEDSDASGRQVRLQTVDTGDGVVIATTTEQPSETLDTGSINRWRGYRLAPSVLPALASDPAASGAPVASGPDAGPTASWYGVPGLQPMPVPKAGSVDLGAIGLGTVSLDELTTTTASVGTVSLSGDGTTAVFVRGTTISRIDTTTGTFSTATMDRPISASVTMASWRGDRVALARNDQVIVIDTTTGRLVTTLRAGASVVSTGWDRTGNELTVTTASTSGQPALHVDVFDVAAGDRIAELWPTLPEPRASIPIGARTARTAGRLWVPSAWGLIGWDTDRSHWQAQACAAAGHRNFTQDEWARYGQGLPYEPTCG